MADHGLSSLRAHPHPPGVTRKLARRLAISGIVILVQFVSAYLFCKLVIRDSQVLAKLGVVTIFFTGWGQTARLQRVRQNTADRIQTETEQQQTARLQRFRQNTADRILKFDKRYKAFEIAGYFQKHREIIG